ncbi:MAG: 16S rRNA (adenine(1518)-N(6)/adenine(1519)-N(6))-dimethyltransferase RsmA [Phycisphaerales bacterium]
MPQTLTTIKALLAERGLHPRKRFGQNFLVDQNKLALIIEAAQVRPHDRVLEVGPGTGVLTEALLDAGADVTAVEIDRDMCAILRERLGSHPNFTLIEADVLATKHTINPAVIAALSNQQSEIRNQKFCLVANLPYNIASPLLATLCADHPAMRRAIIMVQNEVADRLIASSGKDFGPLSIIIQSTCTASRLTTLNPACFWPRPQVDSAVVILERRAAPLTDNVPALMQLVQQLFQHRRKQIASVLGRDFAFPPDIPPTARPEQLTIEQLIALSKII